MSEIPKDICSLCYHPKDSAKTCKRKDCESPALPTGSIAVPIRELEKLEQAREQLYEFLADKLTEHDMIGLTNITGQMWRVANTKNWDRQ